MEPPYLNASRAASSPFASMKSPRVQQLIDALTEAIIQRRLSPGTRLAERELGELFGISRTLVRAAVAQLKNDGLLEMVGPKTVAVVQPSAAHAQAVFEALRIMESGAVLQLCGALKPAQLARLKRHTDQEAAARAREDWSKANQLGRAFHALLMGLVRNPLLQANQEALLNQEAVMSAVYLTAFDYHHMAEDHVQLIQHLESGALKEALAVVERHWHLVIKGHRIIETAPAPMTLQQALGLAPR